MDEDYKGHHIHSSAKFLPDRRWTPHVVVTWTDGSTQQLEQFDLRGGFENEREAEVYGLAFAKMWIDDGKPPDLQSMRSRIRKKVDQ